MDFVVDKVSEDSFYINILAGLPKQLDKLRKIGVSSRYLERRIPVSHGEICVWEQKQSILLPDDLRNFYNSCNGFKFSWTFQFSDNKKEIMGCIEINSLENLAQLTGYEFRQDPMVNTNSDRFKLKLGIASRLYELAKLDEATKIVLVYLNSRYSPTIWICINLKEFYFLADDFTTYFRMCLAHIGIPKWQLLFTPQGVPQWTQTMIRILVPHLLKPNQTVEAARKQREKTIEREHPEIPINQVDTAIFKCLPRLPASLPRVVEKDKTSPRRSKRDKCVTLPNHKQTAIARPKK